MSSTPQSLAYLIEIVGEEAAMKLVEAHGGRSLRVPAPALAREHHLTDLIGREALVKLCAVYGGSMILIVRNEAAVRAHRDRQIRSDHSAGSTKRALAGKYGLTERQIYNILGSLDE